MTLLLLNILFLVFALYVIINLVLVYFAREEFPYQIVPDKKFPHVSVILPVRNEEDNVTACVEAVMEQDYPEDRFQLIVVNDNSTDNTAVLLKKLQKKYRGMIVVNAPGLPAGWTGKSHACHLGSKKAKGAWLVFLDADVTAGKSLLRYAVSFVLQNKMDLLSLSPFQKLVSVGEKFLLPGIFFELAFSMKFRDINNPEKTDSLANGQFMMFNSGAYKKLGGHEAVRGHVMDDVSIAELFKSNGRETRLVFAEKLLSVRMYTGFGSVWKGFSKNLTDVVKADSVAAMLVPVAVALIQSLAVFIVPLLTYHFSPNISVFYLSLFSMSLIVSAWAGSIISYFKISPVYVLAFPFSLVIYVLLLFVSFYKKKNHQREWRGRFD